MIKNVIFDLDGTLIDSSGDVLSCMKKAFKKAGVPLKIKNIRPFMGPPLPGMISMISPDLDEQQINLITGYFRQYYDNLSYRGTKLFKGVKPLLRRLAKMKIKLFIATNKRMLPTKKILKVNGIYGRFKGIFSFDMKKGASMTKTELIGHILKSHELDNTNTILAGDNESDIIAARKNGCVSVAFLGGYGDAKSLYKTKPSYMIKEIMDLNKLIEKLNSIKEGR